LLDFGRQAAGLPARWCGGDLVVVKVRVVPDEERALATDGLASVSVRAISGVADEAGSRQLTG
jgi:hypothetical protein